MKRAWMVAMTSSWLIACPTPDPVDTNNPMMNNPTMNNPTMDGAPTTSCEDACQAILGCQALTDGCMGQAPSMCAEACASGWEPDIQGLSQASCDAAAPFLAARFGLTCAIGGQACVAPATYYNSADTANDGWDACVADMDARAFARFNETISSGGRVGGFEQVAALLWRADTLEASAFVDAREVYAVDEGLDSRIQRREDEHYPPVMAGGEALRCRDEGVPAMDPDRCVGPAKILPILNDAFEKGAAGESMRVQAARIEAALLWFMHVSTYKEATTCTAKSKDCDSAYAYYTGDQGRGEGIGLAAYFGEYAPEAHEAVWEGLHATRCWRDLDDAEEAMDLAMRDRAVGQLDRGLDFGLARVVGARLAAMPQRRGEWVEADWAFVSILGGALVRAAKAEDAAVGGRLEAAFQGTAAQVDVDAVLQDLNAVFGCS